MRKGEHFPRQPKLQYAEIGDPGGRRCRLIMTGLLQ